MDGCHWCREKDTKIALLTQKLEEAVGDRDKYRDALSKHEMPVDFEFGRKHKHHVTKHKSLADTVDD